jgi:hypothetical protein
MSLLQRPKTALSSYGGWIPSNRHVHKNFLQKNAQLARAPLASKAAHIEPVAEFARAIKSDKEMSDLFDEIFLQVHKDCSVSTL